MSQQNQAEVAAGRRCQSKQEGDRKPVILMGTLDNQDLSPIATVAREFMEGLNDSFDFRPFVARRRHGKTRPSRLNVVNLFYFVRHLSLWVVALAVSRPAIVHYPITSFWSFRKGLTFFHVARCFGARCIGHLHGGGFDKFWGGLPPRRRDAAARKIKKLDALIVLSKGWGTWARRELQLDDSHIHVVPNPIARDFEREALQMPLQRAERVVLCVAMLSRRKGVLEMLKAGQEVLPGSGYVLRIAGPEGEPGMLDRCRAYVASHGLEQHVQLPGPVSGNAKIDSFRQAAIFLLPSYAENLPLSVLEAAAAGMPIIASPVGALPELFEHKKSVIFVRPGDVGEISRALRHLMAHPEERVRLGAAAREVFLRTCVRRQIMDALSDTYNAVLKGEAIRHVE